VPGVGSAADVVFRYLANWSSTDDETAVRMKGDLGFFARPAIRRSHEDEFPMPD